MNSTHSFETKPQTTATLAIENVDTSHWLDLADSIDDLMADSPDLMDGDEVYSLCYSLAQAALHTRHGKARILRLLAWLMTRVDDDTRNELRAAVEQDRASKRREPARGRDLAGMRRTRRRKIKPH